MPFFLCGGIYVAFLLAGVFSSWADHADITLFQLPGKDIPLTAVVVSVCSGAKQPAPRSAAPTRGAITQGRTPCVAVQACTNLLLFCVKNLWRAVRSPASLWLADACGFVLTRPL